MRRSMRVIAIALGVGFLSVWAASPSFAQSDQRRLMSAATLTLSNFLNDSDMTWLHRNLGRARAVLIAPRITQGLKQRELAERFGISESLVSRKLASGGVVL